MEKKLTVFHSEIHVLVFEGVVWDEVGVTIDGGVCGFGGSCEEGVDEVEVCVCWL